MKKYFYLLIFLFSCQNKHQIIQYAFYHWTSNLEISQEQQSKLQKLNISKIYVRYFDIDWDFELNEPIPKGKLIVKNQSMDSIEIVPTVFITNRTFLEISDNNLESLVQKTQKAIASISENIPNPIKEIQFDCDWTAKTRSNYFKFLRLFIQQSKKTISSTIRLHQIKYASKTGIPPVDRGMLMYYNMGKVKNIDTNNSILDNKIGSEYISKLKQYPLSLDVALPLYSWAVVFRDGKLIRLINDVLFNDLKNEKFIKISKNKYKVLKSTFLYGTYLYQDDIVRLEVVSKSDLLDAANLLNSNLPKDNRTISFYHLDSKLTNHYENQFLQKIYNSFHTN